jgi:hypothetical protein
MLSVTFSPRIRNMNGTLCDIPALVAAHVFQSMRIAASPEARRVLLAEEWIPTVVPSVTTVVITPEMCGFRKQDATRFEEFVLFAEHELGLVPLAPKSVLRLLCQSEILLRTDIHFVTQRAATQNQALLLGGLRNGQASLELSPLPPGSIRIEADWFVFAVTPRFNPVLLKKQETMPPLRGCSTIAELRIHGFVEKVTAHGLPMSEPRQLGVTASRSVSRQLQQTTDPWLPVPTRPQVRKSGVLARKIEPRS